MKSSNKYVAAVVDIANFLDRDFSNLFEKISTVINNINADIVAVINIHRKDLLEKMELLSVIFKKHSVTVYFATSETDIEVAKFAIRKSNLNNGKVLVATGDISLMHTIASFLGNDKVGFLSDKNNSSTNIHSLTKMGYSVYIEDIISRKEGVINKILHISPNHIRRARGYSLPEEIENQIIQSLPKNIDELKEFVEKNNLMNNMDNFKIMITSLILRDKMKLYHDRERDIINLLPSNKQLEPKFKSNKVSKCCDVAAFKK